MSLAAHAKQGHNLALPCAQPWRLSAEVVKIPRETDGGNLHWMNNDLINNGGIYSLKAATGMK